MEEAGLSSLVQLRIGDAQDLADVPDGSVDKVGEWQTLLIPIYIAASSIATATHVSGPTIAGSL